MRPRILALLAVPALALVGCSASETPAEPTATVTVTASPTVDSATENVAQPTPNPEDQYLVAVRLGSHELSKKSDKELIRLAKESCKQLSEGEKIPEVVNSGTETKRLSANMAVRNAAIGNLCPENL